MERSIRIGKDFNVRWAIRKRVDGERQPYELAGKELVLQYRTPYGLKEATEWTIDGNTIVWTFRGKEQKAPCMMGDVDLSDREAVVEADRKRFAFVNEIVAKVESRKIFTKDINFQDKIDAVLTHPLAGLPIFAVVMFLVFQISQAWLGVWIAEGYEFENGFVIPGLVTLIDGFKEWVVTLLWVVTQLLWVATLLLWVV